MSGGPGGGLPECVGQTYSGFIVPTSESTFETGQTLNISWYGGLVLQTGLTAIFDVVLAHNSSNSNGTSGAVWEKTIFSSKAFVFESDRTGRDGVWTNFDVCGNTAFYQLWTISSDLDFSKNDFVLMAKNITTDTENRTYTSDSFVIRDEASTSTTVSSITTTSSSSTTSLSSPTTSLSSTPTPNLHTGLSTGAKAGIGVGAVLAVIVLLLLGFWLYRKRRRGSRDGGGGLGGATTDSEGYQKAELDGQTVKHPAEEADGVQIFEADAEQRQKTLPPQDPIELPTERFD
ncbi:hypothetical protein BJX65DRAFT_17645 [Aspergillus insuetus]